MHSIFSGWKFWAKERCLLKKYLVECGKSASDMSMMTTMEMRNHADKLGNKSFSQKVQNSDEYVVRKSSPDNSRLFYSTNTPI